MKKNNLLLSILILFLTYALLTWIIPVGYFNEGKLILEGTSPIGIFDLIVYPLITLTSSVFILTAIVILSIGGLYGVLNKTGAYGKLIDNLGKKLKGKEKITLIITAILFTLLSSLTGLNLPLFILIPMAASLLINLGHNKYSVMLATIGGILAGNMASTYGFNVAGYASYLTENINNSIIIKVVMLVLVTVSIIIATLKTSESNIKNEKINYFEKNIDKKANCTKLVVSLTLMFVVIFLGMINWNELFKIELFNNIHSSVSNFKIGGYAILGSLIGTMPSFGNWTNYELSFILIVTSFIIGKLYKLSFNEILKSFIDGLKKFMPIALMTIASSIIFLLMNVDANGYTIFSTITDKIISIGSKLNAVNLGFTTLIGGVLYNEFAYFLSAIYSPISVLTENYSLVSIVTQSIYGLVQFVAPTSIMLVIGLTYFDISYTDWLKKYWKLFLVLLVVAVLAIFMTII